MKHTEKTCGDFCSYSMILEAIFGNSSPLGRGSGRYNFKLPFEYKDVFAWSYKKMLGLKPKVAAYHLSFKKGVSPKKQRQ